MRLADRFKASLGRRYVMQKIAIVVACFLYVISPIDLIPDFFIGLGQADDLGAVILTLRYLFAK